MKRFVSIFFARLLTSIIIIIALPLFLVAALTDWAVCVTNALLGEFDPEEDEDNHYEEIQGED